MWEYTDKVKDLYRNPKNVGEIEDANAVGEVGSLACGDALKLYLKVSEDGIIEDAKFQTFGCGSAVASAGMLTEMIIGKPIADAAKITNMDIADALGGLPDQKMHCSVLGHEALEAALSNYFGTPIAKTDQDRIVCKCFSITEKKVREIIKENKLTSLEDITNFCKAGGGCGMCISDIHEILGDEITKRELADKKPKLTKTQLIVQINKIIENYIAPELQKDGGDIELVDVEDNKIFVKLRGACSHCPSSSSTLKNFVEMTLKEHLGPEIEVIEA
ncbi:MAG: Fe-S cluster assembly protein NifU [bacterium]